MVSTPTGPPFTLGELARAAEVPVGTVKYYLREGLLPEGRLRSATRADYGDTHLARLRLLRLLREVGDVPVGRLRDLVAALEDQRAGSAHGRLGVLAAGSSALAGPVPVPAPGASAGLSVVVLMRASSQAAKTECATLSACGFRAVC